MKPRPAGAASPDKKVGSEDVALKALTERLRSRAKTAAAVAALAIGIAAAGPSLAATYVFDRGDMDTPRTLNIAGIGNVRATPMQFDGHVVGTPNQPFDNLVAFCVDVYHAISLGDYAPDLTYTDTNPLEHDSNWDGNARQTLTSQEIVHIARLVNYGVNVFHHMTPGAARYNELAAVQGAVWEVVSGRNVTGAGLTTRIDQLAGNSYNAFLNPAFGPIYSRTTLLTPYKGVKVYPDKGLSQSFAIAAVPEPAAWMMMIGGFAFAGAMLRRARYRLAPVRIRR